ncbi:hypothetical protein HRI_004331200 [Hibiscus trionum]|uniref:Uncharacterized protein n=1 Tax=Hibiscus trionum TaxID=183268 RepID=A0A9W7J1X3_HIBTR|nr:hypothetical protein HRI_004331200 [Hibiscus trionum]
MNSSSAAVLFLFFLFSANPFSLSATAAREPVLDTDGEELRSGAPYYIRSTIPGAGGLELASLFSTGIPCPKIVAQSQFANGLPVFFNPVDSTSTNTTVYLSTDVNIEFPGFDAYCRSSNKWRVAPYSTLPGHWWIANGGETDILIKTKFFWVSLKEMRRLSSLSKHLKPYNKLSRSTRSNLPTLRFVSSVKALQFSFFFFWVNKAVHFSFSFILGE